MISYIGQFKREKVNSTIREKLKKQKTIYTLMLLGFPLLFLLFDYGKLDAKAEEISGDRMATCKLTTEGSTGNGSAFLISKNGLLITARHCVAENPDVEYTMSFDMIKDPKYQNLKATVVFFPENKNDDYAVLKLINPITNIEPLKIAERVEDPSLYNPKITIIGYPGITPSQSIDKQNSVVNYQLEEDSTIFMISQSFPGYSGGPVIDNETGEVIGILVSGIDSRFIGTELEPFIGMAFCEKIQQIFTNSKTSHIKWE